jgi:nicotinamidase/pyrazinamidase
MHFTYDSTTALIVVDVQNDFADPDGSLAVENGIDVIPRINHEIGRAREAGSLVVYTADWHPESTPHFAKDGGTWPVHCVANTWGSEFHPDLVVDGPIVRKGVDGEDGYSAFSVADPESGKVSATELASLLRSQHVERTVVTGLATDYCVKETALDAVKEGFHTFFLSAGSRPVNLNAGDGASAILAMAEASVEVL